VCTPQLTVWDVDTSRDSARGKGNNIQESKVKAEELVLLKFSGPGELWEELLGREHQLGKLGTHCLVDHGHKTWEVGRRERERDGGRKKRGREGRE